MPKIAIIQMTSGPDPQENLAYIKRQTTLLAEQGAKLIVTPENSLVFGSREDYHKVAEPLAEGELQRELSQLAKSTSTFSGYWEHADSPSKRSNDDILGI